MLLLLLLLLLQLLQLRLQHGSNACWIFPCNCKVDEVTEAPQQWMYCAVAFEAAADGSDLKPQFLETCYGVLPPYHGNHLLPAMQPVNGVLSQLFLEPADTNLRDLLLELSLFNSRVYASEDAVVYPHEHVCSLHLLVTRFEDPARMPLLLHGSVDAVHCLACNQCCWCWC
jgi:hypothetical protein